MDRITHPVHRIVRIFVKNLDENPKVQLRIHTVGFWYWAINFPIVTYMFFFQPEIWGRYGLFVTLIYSIYANWSTDYGGMSSSQSVMNTAGKSVDVKANPLSDGIEIKGFKK